MCHKRSLDPEQYIKLNEKERQSDTKNYIKLNDDESFREDDNKEEDKINENIL